MPTPGDLFGAPKCPGREASVRESGDGTNPDDTVASAAVLDHTRDDVPVEKLRRLGALDENGELTEIGRQMEQFASESPEHARMLAEAERFPETCEHSCRYSSLAENTGRLGRVRQQEETMQGTLEKSNRFRT